uniref:ACYPI001160 protein n=1 Tax=Acyrthosiphon pisum TaxID=7029 RepID=C4WT70_ACYPI|nr:ACYPI001160 [Acyrthosiphon pisum]
MITTEVSKTAISAAAAGIAGLCFVGYCFYFDRKRRSDPNFKSNLRKKRLLAKEHELAARAAKSAFPDFTDQQAVQRFFLQEVQMGESYLEQGDAARGVEHLANAVVVCGQPTELLNVLQRTLPDPVFDMLIKKLPGIGQEPDAPPAAAAAATATVVVRRSGHQRAGRVRRRVVFLFFFCRILISRFVVTMIILL